MAHQWGELSYYSGSTFYSHNINITSITQPHTLDGTSAQSVKQRHFYPRSHIPGNIQVAGICLSQDEYQRLSRFIRVHQKAILDTPNDVRYQFPNSTDSKLLMLLDVPTEQTQWKGFVEKFGMVKKGVFVPAPTYTFDFVVVFDQTSQNFALSNRVNRYYKAGARTTPKPTPNTESIAQ